MLSTLHCFPFPHASACLQNLGTDWDERVLPSIGNEVLKAVVAQYQAEQLLTQVGRSCRGGRAARLGQRRAAMRRGEQLCAHAMAAARHHHEVESRGLRARHHNVEESHRCRPRCARLRLSIEHPACHRLTTPLPPPAPPRRTAAQRDQVSAAVRDSLMKRATEFNILVSAAAAAPTPLPSPGGKALCCAGRIFPLYLPNEKTAAMEAALWPSRTSARVTTTCRQHLCPLAPKPGPPNLDGTALCGTAGR